MGMKNTILIIMLLALSGCAMVSKDIHPKLTYRENPFVEIRAHDSWWSLQSACFRQHKVPHIYLGCSWVPFDPCQNCIINVMRGDGKTLQHELKHCHGYADTMLPWKAQ